MQLSINELYNVYLKTRNNIEADIKTLDGRIDYVNPCWQNIISMRRNFPEFSEILYFLRSDFAFGIGNIFGSDIESKRESFEEQVIAALRKVPTEFIKSFDESLIGTPQFFNYHSIVGSTPFLNNLVGTDRIIKYCNEYLNSKKKINVLEIGAGWGAVAYQLLKSLDINSYTICDIHENLFISSFFLQANFAQKPSFFVINDEFQISDNSLVFCSPKKLKNIQGNYDLIINMQSFQEMYIKNVREYLEYAKEHLSDNGILYSENGISSKFNTQGRARNTTDYGYCDYFNILNLEHGKRFCPHMFHGNKHEIVLSKRNENQKKYNSRHLDALCYLLNIRLDEDIKNTRDSYLNETCSNNDIEFLKLVNDFFDQEDSNKKRISAEQISNYGYQQISSFLVGQLLIAQGKYKQSLQHLNNSIKYGLHGFAKVNALLFIALIQKREGIKVNNEEVISEINAVAPEMEITASKILTQGYNLGMLSHRVAYAINLKKLTIYGYSLGEIMRIAPKYIYLRLRKKIGNIMLDWTKDSTPYCLR